jgi:hypothetical protein
MARDRQWSGLDLGRRHRHEWVVGSRTLRFCPSYGAILSGLILAMTLVSCDTRAQDPSGSPMPVALAGFTVANSSCTIWAGRLAIESNDPRGYAVVVLIDSYNGPGSYKDIVSDQDSQSGTKITIHSLGGQSPRILRGIGQSGTILVQSVNDDRVTGSLNVLVVDAGSATNRFEVSGSWSCLRQNPGTPPRSYILPTAPAPTAS